MRYAPLTTKATRAALLAVLFMTGGLLAGCQTDGSPSNPLSELTAPEGKKKDEPPQAAAKEEPPMTRSRAASECWMKTEKGTASGDLDKRADVVNKCIEDKLKGVAPKT